MLLAARVLLSGEMARWLTLPRFPSLALTCYQPTMGAEFVTHVVTCSIEGVGEKRVKLNIVDCGGEAQYEKMNAR